MVIRLLLVQDMEHDIHQSQIDIGSGKQAVRGSVQINDFLQTVVQDRIRFLMVVCLKMKVYRMHHADGIDSAVIQNDIGKGFRSEVNLLEFTVTVFFQDKKECTTLGRIMIKISGIACDGFCADIHIAEAGENPVKLDRCMDVCPKSESRFFPACQCTCQNIRGQGRVNVFQLNSNSCRSHLLIRKT